VSLLFGGEGLLVSTLAPSFRSSFAFEVKFLGTFVLSCVRLDVFTSKPFEPFRAFKTSVPGLTVPSLSTFSRGVQWLGGFVCCYTHPCRIPSFLLAPSPLLAKISFGYSIQYSKYTSELIYFSVLQLLYGYVLTPASSWHNFTTCENDTRLKNIVEIITI